MENIYAGCIAYNRQGILIMGKSGSGKSDLALRMIMDKGAVLVSDDRTDIKAEGQKLVASCPKNIEGLLEVRGVGIVKFPFETETEIKLVVQLVDNQKEIERIPEKETCLLQGISLPLIKLYPFESSVLNKLVLALGVS